MKSLLSRMSVRFSSYGITNFTTNRSAVKTINNYGFPLTTNLSAVKTINNYGFPLTTRFGTRCSLKTAAKTKKSDSKMDDGFFVVRKGDLVGVYNNLIDCQAQVGSSVCDPPVSVYKGYAMSKECEAYLESCGLKNALYSIRAADLRQELFGTLVPCPFQHPHVSIDQPEKDLWSQTGHACVLEFDGACKGNPGQSGAGAVLRTPDGSLICRLREGLGVATNNVAEYRAMILGLRYALSKGFTSIRVVGDSKLVCMQIQGLWKVRNKNIIKWYEEAKRLKDEFMFFQINHVLRDKNSEADAQANLAVVLAVGEVQEEEVKIGETESQSQ